MRTVRWMNTEKCILVSLQSQACVNSMQDYGRGRGASQHRSIPQNDFNNEALTDFIMAVCNAK